MSEVPLYGRGIWAFSSLKGYKRTWWNVAQSFTLLVKMRSSDVGYSVFYRGTSPRRKCTLLVPYRRPMPRVPGGF